MDREIVEEQDNPIYNPPVDEQGQPTQPGMQPGGNQGGPSEQQT